jgi:hypothetical protein
MNSCSEMLALHGILGGLGPFFRSLPGERTSLRERDFHDDTAPWAGNFARNRAA